MEGVSEGCGDEGPSSWTAAGTQSDAVDRLDAAIGCGTTSDGGVAVGTMTEEELKEKHNQVCSLHEICSLRVTNCAIHC